MDNFIPCLSAYFCNLTFLSVNYSRTNDEHTQKKYIIIIKRKIQQFLSLNSLKFYDVFFNKNEVVKKKKKYPPSKKVRRRRRRRTQAQPTLLPAQPLAPNQGPPCATGYLPEYDQGIFCSSIRVSTSSVLPTPGARGTVAHLPVHKPPLVLHVALV